MWHVLFVFFLLVCQILAAIINPITDVCWDCLFPMTVGGVNVSRSQKDFPTSNQGLCFCIDGLNTKGGLAVSFWEPAHLVDVTIHPYKLLALGGMQIGPSSVRNHGSISVSGDGQHTGFYHAHYYRFPVFGWLKLVSGLIQCVESGDFDVFYMTEFDPLWVDEDLAFVLNGEATLFASQAAQMACIPDCAASTANRPIDKLFWCGGCQGSLYPLTGAVAHHVGAVQASSLVTHRIIAKLHRQGFLKGFDDNQFCSSKIMPIVKKSLYKTQLAYPKAQRNGQCHALGSSDAKWGSGRTFPGKGEEFIYVVWSKKQCCLDLVKPAATGGL